ncbi:MAG: DNA cytosine methyltransferase, partial [Actinomycetaceae bacterium]
ARGDFKIAARYRSTHAFAPRRLNPDKAAPVMTGTGAKDFVHPWLDRTLTVREVARIMGWPDDWSLAPIWNAGRPDDTQKWLGKGITVQVGRWIGGWAAAALEGSPGSFRGNLVGEREWLIDFTHDHKAVYDERTGEARDSRSADLVKTMAQRVAA